MSAPVRTESNGPLVTGVAVGFLSAAALFMALRFYTRGAILKNIGKDDWTMLVALVFSLLNSIAMCFEVKYGMGRHIENVGMEEGLEQLKVRHSMPAPPFFGHDHQTNADMARGSTSWSPSSRTTWA
jgi:hypothetical protein